MIPKSNLLYKKFVTWNVFWASCCWMLEYLCTDFFFIFYHFSAMKWCRYLIRPLTDKSQNAPVPYPTMHHSEHFCSEWCIVGYGTGASWVLWDLSIPSSWKTRTIHSTWSVSSWLLKTWHHKEPGHQQLWYWPCSLRTRRVNKMGTGIFIMLISPKIFMFNPVLFGPISCDSTSNGVVANLEQSDYPVLSRDIKGYLR